MVCYRYRRRSEPLATTRTTAFKPLALTFFGNKSFCFLSCLIVEEAVSRASAWQPPFEAKTRAKRIKGSLLDVEVQ